MSQSKKLFRIYIEDGALQDKALYIKKVIESCKTEEQLSKAWNWGREVIRNWTVTLAGKMKRRDRNTTLFYGADLALGIQEVYLKKMKELNLT